MSNHPLSFKENLEAESKSALTIRSDLSHMKHSRRWFGQTTGASFGPGAITALYGAPRAQSGREAVGEIVWWL